MNGKGCPADCERGQHGVDLALEALGKLGQLLVGRVADPGDRDSLLGERGEQLTAPELALLGGQGEHSRPDFGESLLWRAAVRRAHVHARGGLLHEPGDADGEELVQVGREDRAELDPLEQRLLGIGGELENASVVVEPGQLAVEEALDRFRLVRGPGRRHRYFDCASTPNSASASAFGWASSL
jgi:hypothetical protein